MKVNPVKYIDLFVKVKKESTKFMHYSNLNDLNQIRCGIKQIKN